MEKMLARSGRGLGFIRGVGHLARAWTLRRRAEPQALVAPGGLSSIYPTFIPRGCLQTP